MTHFPQTAAISSRRPRRRRSGQPAMAPSPDCGRRPFLGNLIPLPDCRYLPVRPGLSFIGDGGSTRALISAAAVKPGEGPGIGNS
jgi:hypothetical protein